MIGTSKDNYGNPALRNQRLKGFCSLAPRMIPQKAFCLIWIGSVHGIIERRIVYALLALERNAYCVDDITSSSCMNLY